jgi:hypothetical protein
MRKINLFVFLICINGIHNLFAQHLQIMDTHAGLPLSYATLSINKSSTGMISDELGLISISLNHQASKKDSIWISYVGYESQYISPIKLANLSKSDTLRIYMQLLNSQLPSVEYRPPSADTLLVFAAINTMNKALGHRQWQTYISRSYTEELINNQNYPRKLIEASGERFSNPITMALIIGSRQPHAWNLDNQQRNLENLHDNDKPLTISPFGDWLNYDFSYCMPFSPQNFEKKIEKIYNENGLATHFKITMIPKNYGFMSLLKMVDNKMSVNYYSLLNTERTFFINMNDTTISELHVVSKKKYSFKDGKRRLAETERIMHFTFHQPDDQTLYLSYAELQLKIKEEEKEYKYKQRYWLNKPESADNTTIEEISKRSHAKVKESLFKRDQKVYLFRDDPNVMPNLNKETFWRGIRFPDHAIYSSKYALFGSDPNYSLFK